nr:uncharacterized protein LOC110642325 isoform X1 [Ipomoea trifida]
MYQGNNQQREEPPKESMEDKMVRMFSELRHDVTNMRQEWKQDFETRDFHNKTRGLQLEAREQCFIKKLGDASRTKLQGVSRKTSRDSSKYYGKVKDDALLTVLDSNDDLETFTFDNDASINEKDESIHDIVAITGKVSKGEEEREKSQNWRKSEPGRQTGRAPGPRPVAGFESFRPRPEGRQADAHARPASNRRRYRPKARIADASGRIRPDFARHLPNEEKRRASETRPTGQPRAFQRTKPRFKAKFSPFFFILADENYSKHSKCLPNQTLPNLRLPRLEEKNAPKKRKHDVGSSSRAAEGESDLLIPGGRSLRHLSGVEIARVEELRAKGASGGYFFDLSMLEAYGCREEVERMLTRPSWAHLFSWRDDTYEPVTHEFIATYKAIPSNHMWTPCMKFTLFGREHEVSLIQLGEILGFYTPEDSRTEEWRNLPSDFDSDAAAEAYWFEITNGQGGRFTGTKPNTSKVVRSPLLMMKLLLNLTFGGRNKNLHKIYRFDLFNLWSLEMNEPIQMAGMVQQLFTSQTQPKCPYVWIGPVITRLCHGLGLQAELAREKSIASMQPFTEAHLGRSYAPRIGAAPRPRREEQPQEQEPVVQGGPDVPPEYAEYPPVYDWATMRAFQLQLHNQSMNAFNQRMDLHHEELMRQNEAYMRQEERQMQQFQAIEQLRLWMEQRFPPPSQGGDE